MIKELVDYIQSYKGRPVTLMEVCGTHTMSIARLGIKSLLPSSIRIVSGPGCPVCVTPQAYIDNALDLALKNNVTIATFGDLMRVPGKNGTLADAKANGADVRIVLSPMECLQLNKTREEIVFLSVGFETTTPSVALSLIEAKEKGIKNYSVLTANKTMPRVLEALMDAKDTQVDGFIYPGHVASIEGMSLFKEVSKRYKTPGVVAGFESLEVLTGICKLIQMIETDSYEAENVYKKIVHENGNPHARKLVSKVFQPVDAVWRGFGMIAGSGLGLTKEYQDMDALKRFKLDEIQYPENTACRCGEVLKGILSPRQCALFGNACIPENPVGACMVSSEGSCAAEYRYGGI